MQQSDGESNSDTQSPKTSPDGQVVAAETRTSTGDPLPSATPSVGNDLLNVLRGFLMGTADTVPGVSGGTVALILGHYQRLVTAISHFDSECLSMLRTRQFSRLAAHVDLRFLLCLAVGIVAGIATLAGAMHWLLEHRRPETYSVFFGLILASVWIVHGHMHRWTSQAFGGLAIGIVMAAGITLLPMGSGSLSMPYLFFSASIAICAMILPGISGAFVLLLFGVYHSITGLIKDAAKGNITLDSITQLAVFACGCLMGLLLFSRLLRWLLEHHRDTTMATLMGLMIGSVAKLWPLQRPTLETADLEFKFQVMQFIGPSDWDGTSVWWLIAFAIAAAASVVMFELVAGKSHS